MPRANPSNAVVPVMPAGNPLALPDDIRNDLLNAQAEQITTFQQLVGVKIMQGGAGLYEFGDTNDAVREFHGIILASHPRNVLWDKPFGSEPDRDPITGDEIANTPACVSSDGRMGVPRPGFHHAALGGRAATGVERVDCATCPYNQWESRSLIGGAGKGKAVTNQRALYIMVVGPDGRFERESPVELLLPPTSLPGYDEYLSLLTNRGAPVQTVVTHFTQTVASRGQLRWGVAVFRVNRIVTAEEFEAVMAKRAQFSQSILPQATQPRAETAEARVVGAETGLEDDEEMPF